MACCANSIICVQIHKIICVCCTLIAHTETYLTGMLKCEYHIMLLFSSKLSKGSHDIQYKSHGSQRSSLLGTYLLQASSTSLCSSHTHPPTPPHSSYFKPLLLVVSTNSAASSPTPHQQSWLILSCPLGLYSNVTSMGHFLATLSKLAFPVFFLPYFHVSLYTFLHILFIYCLYYLCLYNVSFMRVGRFVCFIVDLSIACILNQTLFGIQHILY